MKNEATERKSIKLEISLPKLPSSPTIRFSLKAMLLIIALVAGGLGIYSHGRNVERSQHYGGYCTVFVVGSEGSQLTTLRCVQNGSTRELVESNKRLFGHAIPGAYTWPPKTWIERPDSSKSKLKRTISVDCGGTEEEPEISRQEVKLGDTIFFDFR